MIKIIDNIIPRTAQERLINIVDDRDFGWHYRRDTAYHPGADIPSFYTNERTSGYTHPIYANGSVIDENMMPWCYQILDGMTENTGIRVNEIVRIQFNLLYQNPSKTYTSASWNSAHTDQKYDHKVLLYYINESDGDTRIFNQRNNEEFEKFTVRQQVTPTQGTAILFDGNYFHAASNPIKHFKRHVINFNFI